MAEENKIEELKDEQVAEQPKPQSNFEEEEGGSQAKR